MANVEHQDPVKFLREELGDAKAASIVNRLKAKSLDVSTFSLLSGSLSSLDDDGNDSDSELKRARLASRVANLCDNKVKAARAVLDTDRTALDLRSIVMKMDKTRLQQPENDHFVQFRRNAFKLEPTAVIHRMVLDKEVRLGNASTRDGVLQFFSNQPDFNMRSQSSLVALRHPDAFKDIPLKDRDQVALSLRKLQCTQALTTKPESIPILLNAGLSSAFQVSSVSHESFVRSYGAQLGHDEAVRIHRHATTSRARNEHALTGILQTIRGSGIAAVDGPGTLEERKRLVASALQSAITGPEQKSNASPVVDLESLFGSLDYCECSDCNSVTSPAAYFVELLQFLRNNNLSPNNTALAGSTQPGIAGTALENLFARRPDLGCLELTCENTNTILPYIDLANEVMESFVVHRLAYERNGNTPKRTTLDVYNVDDETTSELLSQPQHTNYEAYCPLKDAVFPIVNAPYHQPIDEIRIFLEYLKTSRYELLTTYVPEFQQKSRFSVAENESLREESSKAVERSATAEFWQLTPVEYIAITRQHFWSKRYYELEQRRSMSEKAYLSLIKRRSPWVYWGYPSQSVMDGHPDGTTALRRVKNQLLWRSGLLYADLVDIVKTNYINPRYPADRDLQIFDSIRYSYKYLQSLVNKKANSPCKKYRRVLTLLLRWKPWKSEKGNSKRSIPCDKMSVTRKELLCWLVNWFEVVGNIIVLDSNERPQLPIQGYLVTVTIPERPQRDDPLVPEDQPTPSGPRLLGTNVLATPDLAAAVATANPFLLEITGWLSRSGTITDNSNHVIGTVTPDSIVVDVDGVPFTSDASKKLIFIFDGAIDQFGPVDQIPVDQLTQNLILARIRPDTGQLVWPVEFFSERVPTKLVEYMPATESCNIDNVRLIHLNGTDLTLEEWDRMQIFVRLYRKLGWSVNEIDTAIVGLASTNEGPTPAPDDEDGSKPDWQHTLDLECSTCKNPSGTCGCSDGSKSFPDDPECDCDEDCNLDCPSIPVPAALEISPEFLRNLIDVKRIADLSGLPLLQVLTLWTTISITGNPSLYDSLFLKHSIYAIDPIFKQPLGFSANFALGKISDHIPVILAALRISSDGLTAIMKDLEMKDELTLANISSLYRSLIMSRILGIKLTMLPKVTGLFGKSFGPGVSATRTLKFIKDWQKMQERSFTFPQLNFIVRSDDDPLKPISPTSATVFKAAKTIYDGLTKIDGENIDLTESELAVLTAETVKSKLSLIYESTITDQIVALLDGTTVYSSQGPTGLNLTLSDLQKKVQYNAQTGVLTVTGILTDAEIGSLKAMEPSNKDWAAAIDKPGLQASSFFDQYVSLIFDNTEVPEARKVILEGDIAAPPPSPVLAESTTSGNPQNASAEATTTDKPTSDKKRRTLLRSFMPYLRRILSERFVIDAAAGPAGLSDSEMARLLFTTVIQVEGNVSALEALLGLGKPSESSTIWTGSLIPPASGNYAFVIIADKVEDLPEVKLDGTNITFRSGPNEAASTIWNSDKINFVNGRPYDLLVSGGGLGRIQWRLENGPPSAIPGSAVLPSYTQGPLQAILSTAFKIGLLINNLQLSFDEISFIHANAIDFGSIDLNHVELDTWHRLADYTSLRDAMPAMPKTLLDLFKWAKSPDDITLVDMINSVTNWAKTDIEAAVSPNNFNASDPSMYKNEIQLSKLQKAINLRTTISVDISTLFIWSRPTSFVWEDALANAASIRKQVRSQYDVDTWEKIAKPSFDTLRMHQRDALIAFLLVQEPLRTWGVTDADSLFEFFLIDVQMGACLQTSRIKQAISSVQIFVQRCLLDLERDKGSETVKAAQARYNGFMSGYRVWQANREVFLWPENWLDPALRDDKSSNFKALEAKLLQQDVKAQTVQEEIRGYVFRADQVAHLETIGIVSDDESGDVHFFGKSMSSPWTFFYRKILGNGDWLPWEAMGVDIVTYELNTENGALGHSGSYVLPVLWNNRLLLFLPEFSQKQVALSDNTDLISMGNSPAKSRVAIWWEIKLAWTEYRNGAWTPKQITSQAIAKVPTIPIPAGQDPPALPAVNNYQFIPRVVGMLPDTSIQIGVFNASGPAIGWFSFDGGQVSVTNTVTGFSLAGTTPTDFMFVTTVSEGQPKGKTMFSYQNSSASQSTPGGGSEIVTTLTLTLDKPCVFYPESDPTKPVLQMANLPRDIKFYDSVSHPLLARATTSPTVDGIFGYFESKIDNNSKAEAFGNVDSNFGPASDYDELKAPYALGNWEIGCHVPMLLMNKLLATQQFEEALNVAHYVFNPFALRSTPPQPGDVWRWPPFKNVLAQNALEVFFAKLKPNTIEDSDSVIQKWRDNPFQPFVVARGRRQAMMRWFAVQYIRTLIAYGDYYFMQFTLETIPLAIQLYVRASHIYGQKPQRIPKRGKKKPQSYNSLLDKWDAFSNAVVQLELAFPFSNQIDQPTGRLYDEELSPNLFGFATSRYFCIPNNPNLSAVRDLIDDRLYKIRHCQDINGIFRIPPLFEPKIDPGLLVQAAAAGISIASALSDLNSPMPNYKFYLLLQKALELCGELKGLGGQYLSTKEKIDNEALANIRARQETVVSGLVMKMKKQALDEANASLNALHASRSSTEYKMRHFLNLLGETVSKIPDEKTEFSELDEMIEAPGKTNNTYKLIGFEFAELSKALDANNLNSTIGTIEALAGALHIIPNTDLKALPWGLGVGLRWGAENFAIAATAVARQMKVKADTLSYESTNAGRMATYLRQVNDRIHQVNTAGYEIKNLDAQVKTQLVRIGMAEQEISNQQTAIDNANEVMNYLKNKYTNLELYSWMDDNLKTLHYQTYTLAYQIAKKAERAYCFERGIDPATANFISFGYWNVSRNGILAGENLMLGLKQLEAAYHETRGYDFEITRHVSLRQLNPLSLFDLRENAWCEFVIPELLFDMDFPGHYQRLIRTVSLSIPCVVGPYTSISCTLRLLDSEYRINPIATDKGSYPKSTDGDDPRFRTVSSPVNSIAVSTAQTDSGLFEVNFRDERYMPFEGAGASSRWRLELPSKFRQWDYGTINDVVVHMRYTSKDGGANLGRVAADAVSDFVHAMMDLSQDQGLFALFDLRSEFASDWARVVTPPLTSTGQADPNGMKTITLANLNVRLPAYTRGTDASKIIASDVYLLLAPVKIWSSEATLVTADGTGTVFKKGSLTQPTTEMTVLQVIGADAPMTTWKIQFKGTGKGQLGKGYVIVKYKLLP